MTPKKLICQRCSTIRIEQLKTRAITPDYSTVLYFMSTSIHILTHTLKADLLAKITTYKTPEIVVTHQNVYRGGLITNTD